MWVEDLAQLHTVFASIQHHQGVVIMLVKFPYVGSLEKSSDSFRFKDPVYPETVEPFSNFRNCCTFALGIEAGSHKSTPFAFALFVGESFLRNCQ